MKTTTNMKNSMRFKAVVAIAIVTIFILSSIVIVGKRQEKMSDTLFEYYNVGDDSQCEIYSNWGTPWYVIGQTFTVGVVGQNKAYNITSVKLKLSRVGTPGDILVGIYATNAAGPTTVCDLTEYDGNTLSVFPVTTWTEFVFPSPFVVQPNTKYAIVVKAPYADYDTSADIVYWQKNSIGTYTGGRIYNTDDNGHVWVEDFTGDMMFEVYGTLFQ